MAVISDTPLFTKFGSIIFYFVILLLYVRFFITLYCNPVPKFPLTQLVQMSITVGIASISGIFYTRDCILNNENPVNIPFITEHVQNKNWGYCATNKTAVLAEREYLSKFPLRPMPTKDVSNIFGN